MGEGDPWQNNPDLMVPGTSPVMDSAAPEYVLFFKLALVQKYLAAANISALDMEEKCAKPHMRV